MTQIKFCAATLSYPICFSVQSTTEVSSEVLLNRSQTLLLSVEASWNVMAHAQKPDFVFRRNGRVHLISAGASVQSTTGSPGVRIMR
jgi:hypothetical protein